MHKYLTKVNFLTYVWSVEGCSVVVLVLEAVGGHPGMGGVASVQPEV